MEKQKFTAIGLMSGTSMDGVDASLVVTDGGDDLSIKANYYLPYPPHFINALRGVLGGKGDIPAVEQELTALHIAAVKGLLSEAIAEASQVDVIGFHGHTILHDPKNKKTWQIGDAPKLAKETGIDVVHDFRGADVAAGGQGAPLAPVYHKLLAKNLAKPAVVLNIGGVANVTYIDEGGNLLAFDTGPGNALLNDWMKLQAGLEYDASGRMGKGGKADSGILAQYLAHSYFAAKPPKSLDRDQFNIDPIKHLSTADGAATLTAFTVQSILAAMSWLPAMPQSFLVVGGGRKNSFMMESLAAALSALNPHLAFYGEEEAAVQSDFIEAQAFAYMAVRSLKKLPISFPGTTGVAAPMTGGKLSKH